LYFNNIQSLAAAVPSRAKHYGICCPWQVREETLPGKMLFCHAAFVYIQYNFCYCVDVIRVYGGNGRTLVFCNTKAAVNEFGNQHNRQQHHNNTNINIYIYI
jgi:hypothetical protein